MAVDKFLLAVPLYRTLFHLLSTDQIQCDSLCCTGDPPSGHKQHMNIGLSPCRGRLENVVRHFLQQSAPECSENNHFNPRILAFTIAPQGQVYSFRSLPPAGAILPRTGLISKILFSIIYLDPKIWKNRVQVKKSQNYPLTGHFALNKIANGIKIRAYVTNDD